MDVVYSWAKGAMFQEIWYALPYNQLIVSKKTDVYEGSLIRAFRLLVEVLRQMVQAAKAIGNTELENKFASAITAIKRDIVFAPSLVYLMADGANCSTYKFCTSGNMGIGLRCFIPFYCPDISNRKSTCSIPATPRFSLCSAVLWCPLSYPSLESHLCSFPSQLGSNVQIEIYLPI